jgi:uncharacterized protein
VIVTSLKTRLWGALAALVLVAATFVPAAARDAYVQDGAGLFSQSTVVDLNREIGDFNRQTGKEVVVVTVPSLNGTTIQDAAERTFAQQQVNGILIYMAKTEKKDGIVPDRAAAQFFPSGSLGNIHQAMRGYFRSGDFDTGITTGVNLILDQYRSHERALSGGAAQRALVPSSRPNSQSMGGGAMSLIFLVLVLLAGFMIIRGIFRAMSGPRVMPPGYGPGPGYGGGPGYGAGPGYGYGGGGGGGFFSGLLGGLGGAWLGNELFRGNNPTTYVQNPAGIVGDQSLGQGDAAGWQPDAGQADMGNATFGDFGSSGGGFDGGGGGFDGGGGGGGGGDSGGGW